MSLGFNKTPLAYEGGRRRGDVGLLFFCRVFPCSNIERHRLGSLSSPHQGHETTPLRATPPLEDLAVTRMLPAGPVVRTTHVTVAARAVTGVRNGFDPAR